MSKGKQTYAHVGCVEGRGRKGRDGQPGFTARYNGTCAKCGLPFYTGARITTAKIDDGTNGTIRGHVREDETATDEQESDATQEAAHEATTTAVVASTGDTGLGKAIFAAIGGMLEERLANVEAKQGLSAELAARLDALEASQSKPNTIVVHPLTKLETDIGLTHEAFDDVLFWVNQREHVWLVGPAGSGKTHMGKQAATALGLRYFYCGTISAEYALSGFMNASGVYVRTLFREAYEHGGVFLLDEVDGSDPNALIWLNGALANGECPFPDGMIARHPDFVCMATANTWGRGGTSDYVGTMKQNAAFLNRFTQIAVNYDRKLERAMTGNDEWFARVEAIRERIALRGLKVIVSPRQTVKGAKALKLGKAQTWVEESVIASCMTPDQWQQVKQ